LTVLSGTRDVLNPDAHLLVDRATAAGVEVDFQEQGGQLHVYPLLPTRVGRTARDLIIDRVRTSLGAGVD
jgi:acetyl esterase/lipase